MSEPLKDGSQGPGGWLLGLVIAGAIATAWRLQRRFNHDRSDPKHSPQPEREGVFAPEEVEPDTLSRARLVIGSFDDAHATVQAAGVLRREWPYGFEVYSPNLNEALLEAMNLPRSPTRLWIAAGAIVGELGGWATTIMLSIYWPHHVAGMPIIAIPPFTIISFEMKVLFGIGGGVVGLLLHCRLPTFEAPADYLRRFQEDRFGIVLNCHGPDQVLSGCRLLGKHGAKDIQYA